MDERDRLATSFGDMRRAMIPAFVLDLLATVDGGDELSMTQLATLYVLDAGEPVSPSAGSRTGSGDRCRPPAASSTPWCAALSSNAASTRPTVASGGSRSPTTATPCSAASSAPAPRPSSRS